MLALKCLHSFIADFLDPREAYKLACALPNGTSIEILFRENLHLDSKLLDEESLHNVVEFQTYPREENPVYFTSDIPFRFTQLSFSGDITKELVDIIQQNSCLESIRFQSVRKIMDKRQIVCPNVKSISFNNDDAMSYYDYVHCPNLLSLQATCLRFDPKLLHKYSKTLEKLYVRIDDSVFDHLEDVPVMPLVKIVNCFFQNELTARHFSILPGIFPNLRKLFLHTVHNFPEDMNFSTFFDKRTELFLQGRFCVRDVVFADRLDRMEYYNFGSTDLVALYEKFFEKRYRCKTFIIQHVIPPSLTIELMNLVIRKQRILPWKNISFFSEVSTRQIMILPVLFTNAEFLAVVSSEFYPFVIDLNPVVNPDSETFQLRLLAGQEDTEFFCRSENEILIWMKEYDTFDLANFGSSSSMENLDTDSILQIILETKDQRTFFSCLLILFVIKLYITRKNLNGKVVSADLSVIASINLLADEIGMSPKTFKFWSAANLLDHAEPPRRHKLWVLLPYLNYAGFHRGTSADKRITFFRTQRIEESAIC